MTLKKAKRFTIMLNPADEKAFPKINENFRTLIEPYVQKGTAYIVDMKRLDPLTAETLKRESDLMTTDEVEDELYRLLSYCGTGCFPSDTQKERFKTAVNMAVKALEATDGNGVPERRKYPCDLCRNSRAVDDTVCMYCPAEPYEESDEE